jgi:hypothetical protein
MGDWLAAELRWCVIGPLWVGLVQDRAFLTTSLLVACLTTVQTSSHDCDHTICFLSCCKSRMKLCHSQEGKLPSRQMAITHNKQIDKTPTVRSLEQKFLALCYRDSKYHLRLKGSCETVWQDSFR